MRNKSRFAVLNGYIGKRITGNINRWLISSYKNNPNIVDQISIANHRCSNYVNLDSILGPDYNNLESYFSINIIKYKESMCLGWKIKAIPEHYFDVDFRFSNDFRAIANWNDYESINIYLDCGSLTGDIKYRFCIEDDSKINEAFKMIQGTKVSLKGNIEKESQIDNDGFIEIPSGFIGKITLPLDKDNFESYWSNTGNKVGLIFTLIGQIQMGFKLSEDNIGKTIYLQKLTLSKQGKEIDCWSLNTVDKRNKRCPSSNLPWYGEFPGKILMGMAYCYQVVQDKKIFNSATRLVNKLKKAQGSDGYLGVFIGSSRFSISTPNWDLWNHYHCVIGLLEWYKVSNNKKALEVALKALELVYNTFKDRSYIVIGGYDMNRSIAHAFALAYEITHIDKYLKEAERIILKDCQNDKSWFTYALANKDFYLCDTSRWEALHIVMTLGVLYKETKNKKYLKAFKNVWNSILSTDVHNDGGFSNGEGAIGNPYKEGAIETCCTIAWIAMSNELYNCEHDSKIIDEIERSYFNGLLGSLLDGDKYCTYNTPVNGERNTSWPDGRRVASQQDISFQYNEKSKDMNCCQANIARGLGQLSQWSTLSENTKLCINYFGDSIIKERILDKEITIAQKTEYPLNGKVQIILSDIDDELEFDLLIRIPKWSNKPTITINNVLNNATSGEYFKIHKKWKNNDSIDVDLSMQFTYWKGDKNFKGYASIYYGPILLTLNENTISDYQHLKDFDFKMEYFENASISLGDFVNSWINVTIPVGKTNIQLIDFASAGKYNANNEPCHYKSWIKFSNIDTVDDNVSNKWINQLIK